MSVQFSEEDVKKAYKIARELESYKATIAAVDYPKVLEAIGVKQTADEIKTALDFADRFHGGRMDIERILLYKLNKSDPIKLIEDAMEYLDSNNTGYLSTDDIKFAINILIPHNSKVKEIFEAKNGEKFLLNNNKNGQVKLDDLRKWLNQN